VCRRASCVLSSLLCETICSAFTWLTSCHKCNSIQQSAIGAAFVLQHPSLIIPVDLCMFLRHSTILYPHLASSGSAHCESVHSRLAEVCPSARSCCDLQLELIWACLVAISLAMYGTDLTQAEVSPGQLDVIKDELQYLIGGRRLVFLVHNIERLCFKLPLCVCSPWSQRCGSQTTRRATKVGTRCTRTNSTRERLLQFGQTGPNVLLLDSVA